MASDKQLRDWVSDKLMSVQGFSTSVLVKYVIGLGNEQFKSALFCSCRVQFFVSDSSLGLRMRSAKECSSTGDLVGKLVEYGFSSSAETRSFAADIYAKVPRKGRGASVSFHSPLLGWEILAC